MENGDPPSLLPEVLHSERGQLQVVLEVEFKESSSESALEQDAPVTEGLVVHLSPEDGDHIHLREEVLCKWFDPQSKTEQRHEVAETDHGSCHYILRVTVVTLN